MAGPSAAEQHLSLAIDRMPPLIGTAAITNERGLREAEVSAQLAIAAALIELNRTLERVASRG